MELEQLQELDELQATNLGDRTYYLSNGVFKSKEILATPSQKQTQETFGFKWKLEDTFNSEASLTRVKTWLRERYKSPHEWLQKIPGMCPVILDAGCGAGLGAFEYWGTELNNVKYYGIDISEAVDVARKRYLERGYTKGTFLQETIDDLPFKEPMFDVIFSEGVLHHTDNTEKTFKHLCQFLKKEGLFMFYIYRKKGPVREFTDDYIREKMQLLPPQEGWEELKSLSKLGIELGKLDIEINVPEDIKLLEIPSGKINLQRLFYWHVFKAFYDPKLSFDEMHHINFDWYAPKNAHRHTMEEVRQWCDDMGLEIQHEAEELAGLTCVAKKK